MPQSAKKGEGGSRLIRQLDELTAIGCCPPGDMVVFPVSADSSALSELAALPGVRIERIGPDVVRVRRVA